MVSKCPKCKGDMIKGMMWHAIWVRDGKSIWGESMKQAGIPALECLNCGYLEFYSPVFGR
jgi:Zn ribbon nucleic-acid-binding protein